MVLNNLSVQSVVELTTDMIFDGMSFDKRMVSPVRARGFIFFGVDMCADGVDGANGFDKIVRFCDNYG